MSKEARMLREELWERVEIDGVHLEVVASKITDGEWALSVVNERGISSNWTEFFASAREALDAGKEAIESEGAGPFVDVEGFEYPLDK